MNEVQCNKCRLMKSVADFNKNASRPNGLQGRCRECQRSGEREHYKANPKRQHQVRKNDTKYLVACRNYVLDYLKSHPCVDCGEADIVVLDFDHVRGEKLHNVSDLLRCRPSLKRVMEEVAKCDVRCSNCHRRATAKRHGSWWKMIDTVDITI